MKVKYKIVDLDEYNSVCATINDLYPLDPIPSIKEYTTEGTGEIIEFIPGGIWNKDKFLISDDKSGKFIKIDIENCCKI